MGLGSLRMLDNQCRLPWRALLPSPLLRSPGRAERHGFEYFRHGTLSLYAALNAATEEMHALKLNGLICLACGAVSYFIPVVELALRLARASRYTE
jgi:hypothetical protein